MTNVQMCDPLDKAIDKIVSYPRYSRRETLTPTIARPGKARNIKTAENLATIYIRLTEAQEWKEIDKLRADIWTAICGARDDKKLADDKNCTILLDAYLKFNDAGQERALEYMRDLAEMPRYTTEIKDPGEIMTFRKSI